MRFTNFPQQLAVLASTVNLPLASSAFSLDPYNEYDSYYENLVRNTLGKFHINLSHGNYSANGPMTSPSIQWNVNGDFLLSSANFVSHLTGFNSSFHGLQVPDVYHVVDGHVGAVMYHLQSNQTGSFLGIPVSGKSIDILGGELMVFDTDSLLYNLITVEEIARAESQLLGETPTPAPAPNLTALLKDNPQTSPDFRINARASMASIHKNYNAGKNSASAKLVTSNVHVNNNWNISSGPAAFTGFFDSWKSSFPDLVYHDDYVLADGLLGAVEYVWEGTQTGKYTTLNGTVLPPSASMVRLRGFLFFEFDTNGLIKNMTAVHNVGVIEATLSSGVLYP